MFEVRRVGHDPARRRRLSDAQLAELRTHLRDEQAAVQRTDVSGRTRGCWPTSTCVIAQMLGNQVLADAAGRLVTRSSLIALMYQSSHSAEHSAEHVAIVDALARRDARAAVKLMDEHLHNVEHNLRPARARPTSATPLKPCRPTNPAYPET